MESEELLTVGRARTPLRADSEFICMTHFRKAARTECTPYQFSKTLKSELRGSDFGFPSGFGPRISDFQSLHGPQL